MNNINIETLKKIAEKTFAANSFMEDEALQYALDHFIFKYIFFDFEDENEIKKLALNFINELRSAKEEIFRASADKTYRATVKQLPEDYDPKSWTYSSLAHDLDLIASIDDAIECGYEEGCKADLEE